MNNNSTSKTTTLVVTSAVQFLVPFMLSSVVVALPTIGKEFSAGAVHLSLIEMVYMLSLALFLLPIGRFADIHGHKKIFVSGIAVMIFATIALTVSMNIEFLIILRFVQGVGAAMIIATSLTILTFVFPPDQRGKAMGITVSCVFMGLSAGPTLSGIMVSHLGWRYIFYFALPVEIAAFLLTILKLKGEWVNAEGEKYDWTGSILYMISLFFLIVGITQAKELEIAKWIALCGVAGLIVFLAYEYKEESPLLNIHMLLDNRSFSFNCLSTWINYAASFGVMFFFSIYLQAVKGFSPETTGCVLIIQPVIQAVFSPMAGRLSDRYTPANIATIGMGVCTAGLFVAAFLSRGSSLAMIVFVQILLGSGFALFVSPNLTAIMASVQPVHYGLASALVSTMRYTGMMTSMTIIAVILSIFIGNQPVTAETGDGFVSSMRMTLVIFTVMGLSGVFLSYGRSRFSLSDRATSNN
ncbi:MAG: MFS transporter [Desulfobacteraceae bacterium]|nr:MFS transporter [Desulfobacteraceae bacterium]